MPLSSIRFQSIARRTLWRMALRIAAVIITATLFTYWHLYDNLQSSVLGGLQGYVDARGKTESEHFLLAETQTSMLTAEFLKRLRAMKNQDPQAEFTRIFARSPDGLWRVRPAISDFRNKATVFVRNDVVITPDLRRRLVIAYTLLSEWGPLTTNRFLDSFMNMPEQLSVNFAPFVDWSLEAKPDTDIYTYETVWRSTQAKNPGRRPFWTGIYFDEGARKWMISHVTPGDIDGRWVISSGQDIVIDDLISRTTNQQLPGTYNIILRNDGKVIAHPGLTSQIKQAGGNLSVATLNDPVLAGIVAKAITTPTLPGISKTGDGEYFLGVTRINGPNWLFVTVYPAKLLRKTAISNAAYVLLLGAASLAVELLMLYLVLRRQVQQPLQGLIAAAEQIKNGDFNTRLDGHRTDELGALARSFNAMAVALGERDTQLVRSAKDLAQQVMVARESEGRVQAFSAALPDALFIIDANGQYLEALGNRDLFADADVRGKNIRDLFITELAADVQSLIHRCIQTGELQIYEYPLSLHDHELHWFEGHIAPLPAQASSRPAVIWLARDITARKMAEIELRVARDHLKDLVQAQTSDLLAAKNAADGANQSKTQFLSNMSHELRTPMHAILSFARLGLEKAESIPADKLRRYLQNIVDSGERMLALVNDLLDIARLEAGKMSYQMHLQDLMPPIYSVAGELDELLCRKGLSLKIEIQTENTKAWFDALRIGQVMRNLLSNAIKFSPEGSEIVLKVHTLPTHPDSLIVSVLDRGVGIPEEELEAIFDKFIQSSKTISQPGGTGLGLPICREIVHDHGGKIWANNRAGGGAGIHISLPHGKPAPSQAG